MYEMQINVMVLLKMQNLSVCKTKNELSLHYMTLCRGILREKHWTSQPYTIRRKLEFLNNLIFLFIIVNLCHYKNEQSQLRLARKYLNKNI